MIWLIILVLGVVWFLGWRDMFKDIFLYFLGQPGGRVYTPFKVISGSLIFHLWFMFLYPYVLGIFLEWPSNRVGMAWLKDADFGLLFFLALFLGVFLEEVLLRGIPLGIGWFSMRVFGKDLYLILGYISSIAFGLMHLRTYDNPTPIYVLFIVPQLLGGFIYYWIARKLQNGFIWAVIAHFVFDFMLILMLLVGVNFG